MKKLLALFTLLPLLSWAFPVYTNRLDFDPAESTGQFDDFLWRWSGFDDQRVDLYLNNITASNVGFRLAYPQRGRTFLDVLPPDVTGVTTTIVTEVLDVYTTIYPRITFTIESNAVTNVLVRKFVVDGSFARAETTTVTRPLSRNTVTAFEPASVVYTQTAPQQLTAEYGTVTNLVTGGTNFIVEQTIRTFTTNFYRRGRVQDFFLFTPTQNAELADYGITPPPAINAQKIIYGIGEQVVTNVSAGVSIVTNNPDVTFSRTISFGQNVDAVQLFVSGGKDGQTNFTARTVLVVPQVVGGPVAITQTVSYVLGGGELVVTSTPALFNETFSYFPYNRNVQTNISSKLYTFASPTNQITFYFTRNKFTGDGFKLEQNNITNFSLLYDIKAEGFVATTNTIESDPLNVSSTTVAGASTVVQNFPPQLRNSTIYNRTEDTVSYLTLSIPRTNIPPDGPYFAEVLTYSGSNPTNPTQSRTLAKGQVTIENSLWAITNYAGYTNYPGPWDYLLQDGSRPMTGDFDAGGYGVTNIGSPYIGFEDGTYISPSNVALWNSFIQGTSVGLTVSTEFGGQVTGVWNNLTLRKNALDNMEFLDLTTSPTGTAAIGRMVWNADRETYEFGMDAAITQDIGQQTFAQVKNAESVTISNGMVVYIAGASGDKATVKIASYSNDTLSARTIGIAAEDIGPNGTGFVVTSGPKYNQDTSAFSEGAMLWLGAYGNLTTNRPQAPLHGVFIGVAEKINANAGVVFVKVQNGFEIDELHDVNVGSPATNDLLIYNGTVWTNYARTNLSGIYLPLTGGTMSGTLNMSDQLLQGTGGKEIDFDSGLFTGTWSFNSQPTIPGYLTSTGAAAIYATGTPLYVVGPEVVTTNNLSNIAGSGLGVTGNQLVVTNVAGTFESLTGDRFVLGNTNLAGIQSSAKGAFVNALITGTNSIGIFAYGAQQSGRIIGTANINRDAYGSQQSGQIQGTANIKDFAYGSQQAGSILGTASIESESYGSQQFGYISGTADINSRAYGSSQRGFIQGIASIGNDANGAVQVGHLTASSTATNNAPGAMQLIGGVTTGEVYTTTSTGKGSLLLGPGTQPNAYGILANGPIETRTYFVGSAAALTNFPGSLLTVSAGNANYWRITTAPTGATAFGTSGQMAVSGTNFYIYSPNALGTGTGRWGRVNLDVSW